MNGRIEGEKKKAESINRKLKDMPDFVSEWVLTLRASDKTESTIKDYVCKIHRFLSKINPDIKNIKAEDITATATYEYFISLKTKENEDGDIIRTSDSYRQTVWCCLNNFLGFMEKRNYISRNYIQDIDKPKNNDLQRINRHRKYLTAEDFDKILNAVDNSYGEWKIRDKAIIKLFTVTGMRETALSQINLDDIDFENRTLIVRDKGDREHCYVLGDNTTEILIDWINDRNNKLNGKNIPELFISNHMSRISVDCISNIVKKYTWRATGERLSPHKLRAGFCSILYQTNPDVLFVSRAVGHSDTKVTQRYIVTNDKEKEMASGIMDGLGRRG